MKNPFIVLSGCLLLACACGGGILIPDRPVEGAEIVSGVERSTITEFREDAEGFIWMNVSQNGLLRFDGRTLIHYTASSDPRSLSADMVNSILTDREGRLWAATQKGVDRFDREKGAFVHFDIEDTNTYVVRLATDPQGNLYAMTRQALLKFNPASGRFEHKMDAPRLGRRDPFPLFDARGNLWILADEEVIRYDADYRAMYTLSLRPARNRIVSDGDNCLLFVEDGRLKALDTGSGRFCILPPALRSLSGREVSSVYDADGLLLIRAAEGNLVYEKASKMLYDAAADSPYRRLLEAEDGRGFFYDSRGNLWFARGDAYEVIRGGEDQETRHAALSAFLKDHPWRSRATDGRFLWFILQDNSLLTYDLGRRRISGITDLRPFTGGIAAHQVLCSADGRLLLNGSGRGTASVWTLTVDENGLPELECTYTADTGIMATFDEEGGIWAAGVGTRFYHGDRGEPGSTIRLEPVPEIAPFSELAYACHVRTLRDGGILVGFTDHDPLVLDPRTRTIRFLNLEREHTQIFYFTMLEDSVGDLWIGSTDNGLFHHVRSEGRTVHVAGAGTGIGDVQEDRSGRILILSDDKYLYAWNRKSDSSVHPLWKDISGFPLSKHLLVLPGEGIELYSEGHVLRFDDSEMPDREVGGRIHVTLASGNRELATFSTAAADAAGRIRLRIHSVPANLNMHVSVTDGEVGRTYNYLYGINDPRGGMHESAGNPEIALYGLSTGRNRIRFQVRRADTLAESPLYTVILSVKHRWYEWGILLASVLVPVLAGGLFWTARRRKREAREARRERELQEEVNLRNIDFFANIPHEFRTPPTVIDKAVPALKDEAGSPEEADRPEGKPTLLLIDDDHELVYYMRTLFAADYDVHFRFDVPEGYEQVQEVNPDVIICDMMMLDVEGPQFCRMVKEHPDLCHIPVIMLTARSSVDDRVRSLDPGADVYVIKPFNPVYLTTLVRSMIDKRNRVREMLSSMTSVPEDGAEKINIKDKLFMDKVYEILESCMAEGDIDIDSFASRIGISRSKFFYKIKALTGQTPGEFFTAYRLNRAARLIAEDRYKISAVAAMVGFSSPSHFSMVFKKQFGVLPSQYQPRGDAEK